MSAQKVLELDRGLNYELLLGSKALPDESMLLISSIAIRVPCNKISQGLLRSKPFKALMTLLRKRVLILVAPIYLSAILTYAYSDNRSSA